jgi:hypothetical protein
MNAKIDCQLDFYISCDVGKQCKSPFQKGDPQKIYQSPLELVHRNLFSLMKTTSMGGTKYFMTFIDDNQVWHGLFFWNKIKSFGSLSRVSNHGGD